MQYTREQLLEICEAAFVKQEFWHDRDSCEAQKQLGECYALLKAGCKFEVKTKENSREGDRCISDDKTIWLKIMAKNFAWFSNLDGDEADYPDGFREEKNYYLPTLDKLQHVNGKDWY